MTTTILIPVDEAKRSLAILEDIKNLFPCEDVELIFLQVIRRELETIELPPSHAALEWTPAMYQYFERRQQHRYLEQLHQQEELEDKLKQSLLTELAERLPDDYKIQVLIHFGNPIDQLEQYISTHDVDLVAMVTHAREGLERLLFGSISGQLVHDLSVPVLLRHPADS